ncbi:FtsW/RodA/SpoVE family cell cycle protein [Saccharibacillus kuerlensis]|uniref:Rod shape-determining protein RodA n=1 Tax=Saccharibacillus kuerlensis TaxID=459527 RepID=A0ABQ2KV03_9BACL|nr:FtsW/RodA/SpoVE family cell cycle protein [Saccharibacillus kuerlensis]GGN93406.1 rod shape-determining protein RodA [Saccharibacillus kuerlensis]
MLSRIKNIDWTLVVILLLFMGICIPVVHSAITNSRAGGLSASTSNMVVYYILGFIAFFAVGMVPYQLLIKYALYIYVIGIGVLMLVWTPLSTSLNGADGWISIGGLSIQPAEMFKLVLILGLAAYLVRKQRDTLLFWKDVIPTAAIVMIPFAIVMVQNDLGNALAYLVILVGMLWIANVKYTHALIFFVLATGLLIGGINAYKTYHEPISDFVGEKRAHWLDRIDVWLMPEEATEKAKYQVERAQLAIGNGGMLGTGFMKGEMSPRVPYTYADSVIAVIAEEFGFVGMAFLLLLYFILIHRMILIALECRERAGPYIIVGIVAMFMYQIFENIGMFMGLMPLTGVTLPFISYGGTSLLINMACIGVVLSIHLSNKKHQETDNLLKTDHLEEKDKENKRKFKMPNFKF